MEPRGVISASYRLEMGVGHRDNRSSPSRGVRLYKLCCYNCVQLSRGKFFEMGLVVRTLSSNHSPNHRGHSIYQFMVKEYFPLHAIVLRVPVM